MQVHHAIGLTLSVISGTLAISGCKDAKDALQNVTNTFNSSITRIAVESKNWTRESQEWRDLMQDLRRDLKKLGEGELARQIDEVTQRTGATLREDVQGTFDFLADRLTQTLVNIRDKALGKPPTLFPPKITKVIPDQIKMKLPPDSRTAVVFSGYDLDHKDTEGRPTRAVLVQNDGKEHDVTASLARSTHYRNVLNIAESEGGMGKLITPLSHKIRLFWGQTVISEIAIVHRTGPSLDESDTIKALRKEQRELKARILALSKSIDLANTSTLLQQFRTGHWEGYGHQNYMQTALRGFMNSWPARMIELQGVPTPNKPTIHVTTPAVEKIQDENHVLRQKMQDLQAFVDMINRMPMVSEFQLGAHWDGWGHQHHMQSAIRQFMRHWREHVPTLKSHGIEIKKPDSLPPIGGKYPD